MLTETHTFQKFYYTLEQLVSCLLYFRTNLVSFSAGETLQGIIWKNLKAMSRESFSNIYYHSSPSSYAQENFFHFLSNLIPFLLPLQDGEQGRIINHKY